MIVVSTILGCLLILLFVAIILFIVWLVVGGFLFVMWIITGADPDSWLVRPWWLWGHRR